MRNHTRVSVADSLRRAGFSTSTAPGSGVDAIVVPGQVGAIYLPDRNARNIVRAVEAITSEPWCGPVFTASKNEVEGRAPGTLGLDLVGVAHAPDVAFSFRANDDTDPFGLIGGTYYDNDRGTGLRLTWRAASQRIGGCRRAGGFSFPRFRGYFTYAIWNLRYRSYDFKPHGYRAATYNDRSCPA